MSEETISRRRASGSEQIINPLSPSQERFWILDELDPDHAGNKNISALRMRGPLSVSALHRSLNEIVARHEILRTTFERIDGELRQIVSPRLELELATEDLREFPRETREAELRKRIRLSFRRPFELTNGPLIRARLLKLDTDDHVLLVVTHHTTFDGLSKEVLYSELVALYPEFCRSGASTLPPLEWQYRDYIEWRRQKVVRGDLERELAYWAERLADGPPWLGLPTDRPRTRARKRRGDTVELMLSGSRLERLRALKAQENTSLTNLLLTTFNVLLHRYTGQNDICMGIATGGRSSPELHSLLGVFINTVVLRTDLSDDPTFRAFSRKFREVALAAYRHSEIPFEEVLAHVQAKGRDDYGTFPEVICTSLDVSRLDPEMERLKLERIDISPPDPHFELTFYVYKHPEETRVVLAYDTALFDRSTIERMGEHYLTLLDGVVANPRARLSELPILGANERDRILLAWNDTGTSYPRDSSVPELFEEQVARSPDAVAVEFEDQALTYSELNRRANRVAHYLIRHGVGPEVKVGIALERSIEMVVGILGVLKAGGAYVPLDPSYPKSRLSYMVEDTRAPVLLTQEHLVPGLPEYDGELVRLDADWGSIASESGENPGVRSSAEDLAYVIYTSGSTGLPKGVCVPHRGVSRLVLNTDYCQVVPSDRVAQASNASFDAATFEIWGGLLNGARVIGISKDVSLSARSFAEALRKHRITTLFLTTALFNQLSLGVADIFGTLRHLMFGGELVDEGRVRAVLEHGPPQRLLHVYGPTECTTFSTWYAVQDVPEDAPTIPIGRPISNSTMFVLDHQLNPVPVGVSGELYLGGDGLAREYLNDPGSTAESLVPDPFGEEPGSRLYRTGDRARYLPDGTIEFLGRIDYQVKIRGFRIELGEIETALLRYEAIQEVVVLCREDEPGEKYLAAYVVVEGEENEESLRGALRGLLRESLPSYMVPTAFVFLESLPLSPNGKVDRRALPVPQSQYTAAREYAAPGSETEKAVAAIWQEILGQEGIGLHDDFFDLGGHSLMATRILTRVWDSFELRLPVSRFFDRPTVAGLAELIDGTGWVAPDRDDRTPAVSGDREEGEV